MKKERAVRLKTLPDVRRFMANITNKLNSGEIEESKARCFGYLCSVLKDLIKDSDMEIRLSALEKKISAANP
ncbi:MAG: hypothetical protein HQK65_15770 [Desulfamplus sp.]|nr:hypothetical protein [Desulfamplus sp.]MBF0234477.1 hypothetical protein [Desulfamplus sp.]